MAKFHITAKGVPAPCYATKKECPRGGENEHFDSREAAQRAIDEKNSNKYGIINKELTDEQKLHIANTVDSTAKIMDYEKESLLFFRTTDKEYKIIDVSQMFSNFNRKQHMETLHTPEGQQAFLEQIKEAQKDDPGRQKFEFSFDTYGNYVNNECMTAVDYQNGNMTLIDYHPDKLVLKMALTDEAKQREYDTLSNTFINHIKFSVSQGQTEDITTSINPQLDSYERIEKVREHLDNELRKLGLEFEWHDDAYNGKPIRRIKILNPEVLPKTPEYKDPCIIAYFY